MIRRCVRASLLVVLLAYVASAQSPAQPADDVAQYRELVTTLAADRMQGRDPGSEGIVLARDYLLEQLKATGLTPAFGDSYLQPFQMNLGAQATAQSLAASVDGKKQPPLTTNRDFSMLGFSGKGDFAGQAAFVGYGIRSDARKHDDYANAADTLKGKVAVVFRFEPMDAAGQSRWAAAGKWSEWGSLTSKARWAADAGAVAMIIVNPPNADDKSIRTFRETLFGERVKLPVMQISSAAFAQMLSAAGQDKPADFVRRLQRDADAGIKQPADLGFSLSGQAQSRSVTGDVHNIAAILPGSGKLASQIVVIGGHYDHIGMGARKPNATQPVIYHGADDNASGSSGAVMTARWAAAWAKRGLPPGDRRTLLFACFTGEERGLLGSAYMAKHPEQVRIPAAPGAASQPDQPRFVAMICLDMIGRLRNNNLNVWGIESGDGWRTLVSEVARDTKAPFKLSMSGGGFGPSDYASFYAQKVPAIFPFTGGHSDVHQPTDTADKINFAGGVAIARLALAIAQRLATESPIVAYAPPKLSPVAASQPDRNVAFMGVSMDLQNDDTGCRVGVIGDGPASRAGLRTGDVIVQIDTQSIDGPGELLQAVGAHKPGDKVKVSAFRDGKKLDPIEVTLGRRQ